MVGPISLSVTSVKDCESSATPAPKEAHGRSQRGSSEGDHFA